MWPAPGEVETAHGRTCGGESPCHGTPRRAWRVPRGGEPGSGTASLENAYQASSSPGPVLEDVLEAAEGPPARHDDRQPIGPVPVRDPLDGALAPHGEPAVGVLIVGVFPVLLSGVVDRRLRPDLAGAKIDPPAAVDRVACRARRRAGRRDRRRLLRRAHKAARRSAGPARKLPLRPSQREEESITSELQHLAPEPLRECDDASPVLSEDGASKSRSAIVRTPHQFKPGTVTVRGAGRRVRWATATALAGGVGREHGVGAPCRPGVLTECRLWYRVTTR